MPWQVLKKMSVITVLFGLKHPDVAMASYGSLLRQTNITVTKLSGLTPVKSIAVSSEMICALKSAMDPSNHLMCHVDNVCSFYNFSYPAYQEIDPGNASQSCYTDRTEVCLHNDILYEEGQTLLINCEKHVCIYNKFRHVADVSSKNCDGRFYYMPGIGCITAEHTSMNQCQAKTFCSNLGARLLIPRGYSALKAHLMNSTIFPPGNFYWVGMERLKWLDGTAVSDEYWERVGRYEPNFTGICGSFYTSPGYGLWDGSCWEQLRVLCMK
ncbi:uncharacterized protein LOC135220739 [Macrobrachium nipponense]|uniref:uncharacterized protein LOC135220739 n=1 Tax=Macrobrachium nipponense TaxID=159736 RepID=UPI0030C837A4